MYDVTLNGEWLGEMDGDELLDEINQLLPQDVIEIRRLI